MEQVTLEFQERITQKKAAVGHLRTAGSIPAVVYGQGLSVSISVNAHEFEQRFASFGENTVIKLQNGKTTYEVLVKDYQDDVLSGHIQHIDFYQVSATKVLHAKVPVHLKGTAVGVRNGGNLETVSHEVEVECLAKDLPHSFEIDVSNLDVGQSIFIRDLAAPKGVKILTNGEAVVAHVVTIRNVVEEAPAAEAASEPEAAEKTEKVEKKA